MQKKFYILKSHQKVGHRNKNICTQKELGQISLHTFWFTFCSTPWTEHKIVQRSEYMLITFILVPKFVLYSMCNKGNQLVQAMC